MSFDILVFLFVLGILIFVHEMGHFLAAKACNIYVDRFSLGMPPRLFGFKYGETDYCIGALPIGGYVKMAGQEDAPLSDEEREGTYGHVPPERWFNNKPRYQRAFVLIAGPAMNLVLGFVVYAIMAGVGGEVPLTQVDQRIGSVREDSPASSAEMYLVPEGGGAPDYSGEPDAVGWQTGDRIIRLNGNSMNSIIPDVAMEAALGRGEVLVAEIERTGEDGIARIYQSRVQPELIEGEEFPTFGITAYNTALIAIVPPGMPAAEAGIQPQDEIIEANGQAVDLESFLKLVQNAPTGGQLDLVVLRDGEKVPVTVNTLNRGRVQGIALSPSPDPLAGLASDATPEIGDISGAVTRKTGLNKGDRIQSVATADGEPVSIRNVTNLALDAGLSVTIERSKGLFGGTPESVNLTMSAAQLIEGLTGASPEANPKVLAISEEAAEATGLKKRDVIVEIDGQPASAALLQKLQMERIGESVPITVERPAVLFGLYQKAKTLETELPIASIQEIGVVLGEKTVFHREPPGEIIPEAWNRCVRVTVQIGTVLKLLVTGGLSAKALGGPVMIYDLTTGAAKTNLVLFLDILAMISINLAIFNLLPLPVLDGGQLVVIAIEAIRRKPISMKVLETVQQAGLLLIIGLILFVTFNDVSRIVDRILP